MTQDTKIEAVGHTALNSRVNTIIVANSIGGSEVEDPYATLSRLIATRLLGVKPDEQVMELDDHDWRLIIDALSHKALILAEQTGGIPAPTAPDLLDAVRDALEYLRGENPHLTSGGIRNSVLRSQIIDAIAKAEGRS